MQHPLRMPGATLATRLKVYDTAAPDGKVGGTPHVHFMCTEMYFVTVGSGTVEVIDMNGISEVELHQHSAFIFSPGTLHRLINPNKDLELFIVMQNSGLPERGDNVVTFVDEIMQSDKVYAAAMQISSPDDAYRRRDQGVEGFNIIKNAFETSLEDGQKTLKRFYTLALARIQPRLDNWDEIIQNGALAEAQEALQNLQQLRDQNTEHLLTPQNHLIHPREFDTPGFCGTLNRYFDPATLALEGKVR